MISYVYNSEEDQFYWQKNKKRRVFSSILHFSQQGKHHRSCDWYILDAKTILDQMGYNFLFWKLRNHILSDGALSWHQEYTSHMMYDAFLIEKNAKYLKKRGAF